MKRCGKILLMLIGFMSLASCEKYTTSEINEFRNIPVEYLFIVNCKDGILETTNTFEFHSVEKMGDFGGCYLTCKNPQATLTIQRYVNGKRKKTIYGKGSVVFNAKDDMFPFLQ